MKNKLKKFLFKVMDLFFIGTHYKEYKNYKGRLAGNEFVDFTNKVAKYEVHSHIKEFTVSNGKLGKFKLLTWLPFMSLDESYNEFGEKCQWQFIGFKDEAPINQMTFKEFLESIKDL